MSTSSGSSAVLDLVKDLIARPSVTPADEDCQATLAARLERIGFRCETIAQGGVTNLWARRGSAARWRCSPATRTWCRRARARNGRATRSRRPSATASCTAAARPT